jgi:orotidine-5'-phosphate decarboxylase
MADIDPRDRLIVALDVDTRREALQLVERLHDSVNFYKVGWQLFLGEGWETIKTLRNLDKKVFLDLKIEDVPETVELAVRNMIAMEITFCTIKGNSATTTAARDGRGSHEKPKFLQLTVLSSWDQTDLDEHLRPDGGPSAVTLEDFMLYSARKHLHAGCEGLIASGNSIRKLRNEFDDTTIIVAPGIRPKGMSKHDHKRSLTPEQAILDGADYLVVGRPIRDAVDPRRVAERIVDKIRGAVDEKTALECSFPQRDGEATNIVADHATLKL